MYDINDSHGLFFFNHFLINGVPSLLSQPEWHEHMVGDQELNIWSMESKIKIEYSIIYSQFIIGSDIQLQ